MPTTPIPRSTQRVAEDVLALHRSGRRLALPLVAHAARARWSRTRAALRRGQHLVAATTVTAPAIWLAVPPTEMTIGAYGLGVAALGHLMYGRWAVDVPAALRDTVEAALRVLADAQAYGADRDEIAQDYQRLTASVRAYRRAVRLVGREAADEHLNHTVYLLIATAWHRGQLALQLREDPAAQAPLATQLDAEDAARPEPALMALLDGYGLGGAQVRELARLLEVRTYAAEHYPLASAQHQA